MTKNNKRGTEELEKEQKKIKRVEYEPPLFDLCCSSNDIVDFIFSFLKLYRPLLKFVCKQWYQYFKDEGKERGKQNLLICQSVSNGGYLECLKWLERNQCPFDEWIYQLLSFMNKPLLYASDIYTSYSFGILCTTSDLKAIIKCQLWAIGIERDRIKKRLKKFQIERDKFNLNDTPSSDSLINLNFLFYEENTLFDSHKALINFKEQLKCIKTILNNPLIFFGPCNNLNNKRFFKWVIENGIPWDESTCGFAALIGNLDILKWLKTNNCPWDEFTCHYAAYNGHLDCLKWARNNGCDWNEDTCSEAAEHGHLDCLKWAHENGCNWDEDTCSNAALNGNLDCLKYAKKNGCDWNEDTCSTAALSGYLDCLKWARENGCDWDWRTCFNAARNGHLDCLKWSKGNGCDWDEDTCASAARGGHLDCLKWSKGNGCDWDEDTCSKAAGKGHLDCLKWARENGCPWNAKTCFKAAAQGHLDCLKWAEENEWDEDACASAAKGGHLDCLKWIKENGCPEV